ncbi:MAG TPA: DNA-directed RNA polymerase subunit alpha [Candidatus Saccharimonadales bacterium]|nr:DNA-directed RNA polymerase subunit alpha [Candidatus Saccharimonadales bacterium]
MSKSIHVPGVVKTEDHGKNQSTFTVEPLHSGYGMTLGNSLRRVLLSSIAGAAVTAFRAEGASHEFTTLPGVKEDIVEIVLNLKGVRFRVFSDEPQTIRLSKKGSGPVTAKDIETNADVEVVNKDHVIAHIDNASSSLNMDIVVEKGRGYRAIDESGANKKTISDMIAIDSIFSPVQRVRYKVENTRVGQMTDLDKLIITVETDGTISPREAFEEASAILVNQYTALAGQTTVEQGAPLNSADESGVEAESSEDAPALMTSIEDLNLSARTTNALVNNDIHTLKDLFALSDIELKELKGFGSKALDEVKEKMAEMDF